MNHQASNVAFVGYPGDFIIQPIQDFQYAPSDTLYWQLGHSTEQDFIYVTTANLTHEQLQELSDDVGDGRTLLDLCTAFRGRGDYVNLTVKKIPRQVLSRCEWGHDDYSLKVENLPAAPPLPPPTEEEVQPKKGRLRQASLFGEDLP
jgi:adenine-specific DNA-methyltransferase